MKSFRPAEKKTVFSFLLAFSLLWLWGCAPGSPSKGVPSGQKKVLTTFTILQDMAQNVAGDRLLVESITKPGAEIHDYEPTPRDIARAQSADLILDNGMGLERWFEKFYGELKGVKRALASAGIQPVSIVEGPYTGKPNPHSWMSPANALVYVENIRKALSDLDPANAEVYKKNAANYSAEILKVDGFLRKTLGALPANRRYLVSCEAAFSYLTRDYGMKELSLWPVNADEEGTPQQIKKVIDTVRAEKIPVVFSESTISPKPIQQVAKETGATYGGVLYVDSLTKKGGVAPNYLKLLEYNADVIVKGLTGSEKK